MKQPSDLFDNTIREVERLEKRYRNVIEIDPKLTRQLVSFQANKKEPGYKWYKFKEGFSSNLVKYYIKKLNIKSGKIIDPFAGSGTTLFASSSLGLNTVGIELLPIGYEIMKARQFTLENREKVLAVLKDWILNEPWKKEKRFKKFPHLTITSGAFSPSNENSLCKYIAATEKIKDKNQKQLLQFAALCILEEISYTRKDGQYLRWDSRSPRKIRSSFNKGVIKTFNNAISEKLKELENDLINSKNTPSSLEEDKKYGSIELIYDSCLYRMSKLKSDQFSFLITSPPYCNRYDYTRTYALELALLGINDQEIKNLRQAMLSCTVENKEKQNLISKFNKILFEKAKHSFESQKALRAIIKYLEFLKKNRQLNNSGIARMVNNYFFEMSLIIFEAHRILKKSAPLVMVNDNVRYAGITIPVDLIMSDFAKNAGFDIERIWVLPRGKGNSSQQMGKYGRSEIRKCVYVWRKK